MMITSREAAYMGHREADAGTAGGLGDLHACPTCGRRASYRAGEDCGDCVSSRVRKRNETDREAGA